MTIYLHDGSSSGHTSWTVEALTRHAAAGAVISPFFTPNTARKGQPSGDDVANKVRAAGGEAVFDPTTHAVGLPGVDNWRNYRTWDLWGGAPGDLSTSTLLEEHVRRCADHSRTLRSPVVAPTLALDSPVGGDATVALALADAAKAEDSDAWQSLAGRRGFWLSDDLDTYVGALAQLRPPVWMITVVRDLPDFPPDMTESRVMQAVCRTVDSLSRRSRVILCHSDLTGLPGVAAGADTIGTGWHTKQRVACSNTYQQNDPDQIRRQAKWFTYERLAALIHEQQSDILVRSDRPRANRLYRGTTDAATGARRVHHLQALGTLADEVTAAGANRRDRVRALRAIYETAISELDSLATSYGRPFATQRAVFVDGPYAALEAYAVAEGIW
jgi:hypothetical protein